MTRRKTMESRSSSLKRRDFVSRHHWYCYKIAFLTFVFLSFLCLPSVIKNSEYFALLPTDLYLCSDQRGLPLQRDG